jgi:hypothetical protein
MRKSSGTPSLAPGQEYKNRTGNSFRPKLHGGTSFPEQRDVDAERATKYHPSVQNAKAISHGAKAGKRVPR